MILFPQINWAEQTKYNVKALYAMLKHASMFMVWRAVILYLNNVIIEDTMKVLLSNGWIDSILKIETTAALFSTHQSNYDLINPAT